jgi:spore coat protein U-like protein
LPALLGATATGNVSSTCLTGQGATKTWDFCASIGVGTNSVSQTDRRMTSGSNYISYQLYTDSGYSNPYQYPGTNMVALTYNALTGAVDTQGVYGKILSSGAGAPPGIYTDTYLTGAQAAVTNDSNPTGIPASECTGNSGTHYWNTTAFTVTAIILASCGVTATPLNFGTVGVLSANIDVATNLAVTCTFLTPYTVGLSAGNAPGATTSTRAMTLGAAEVFYSLYQDSARMTNWGSNIGVDTISGIGTGAAQTLPVYGRVPPQTTPTVGTYSDTVVVTVTY